jgi:universal stress protein A
MDYKSILLAVDLSKGSHKVAQKALAIASASGAKLNIVHVVEPITLGYGAGIAISIQDIQEELTQHSRKRLTEFADQHHIPEANRFLEAGARDSEILRVAKEQDTDLIIVGSHGTHGLGLLLGSTSNDVLHHTKCDMLAVRILPDDEKQ